MAAFPYGLGFQIFANVFVYIASLSVLFSFLPLCLLDSTDCQWCCYIFSDLNF